MTTTKRTAAGAAIALAAALALSACQRDASEQTAGERLDTAVASAEQRAEEARSDVAQGTREMQSDMGRAADAVGDKVKDMSITTAINAELARDNDLSALRINVDTVDGRVILRGDAPNEAARERAATLAGGVDGVVSVDNQLRVGTPG